jgi:hypothetical protein
MESQVPEPPGVADQSPTPGQLEPGRKRRKVVRSRAGCLICRKRRKACDMTKPQCGTCVRLKMVSGGMTSLLINRNAVGRPASRMKRLVQLPPRTVPSMAWHLPLQQLNLSNNTCRQPPLQRVSTAQMNLWTSTSLAVPPGTIHSIRAGSVNLGRA